VQYRRKTRTIYVKTFSIGVLQDKAKRKTFSLQRKLAEKANTGERAVIEQLNQVCWYHWFSQSALNAVTME